MATKRCEADGASSSGQRAVNGRRSPAVQFIGTAGGARRAIPIAEQNNGLPNAGSVS